MTLPQNDNRSAALLPARILWALFFFVVPFRWNYAVGSSEIALFPTDIWELLLLTVQPHFLLGVLAAALLLAELHQSRRLVLRPNAALALPLLATATVLCGLAGLVHTTEHAFANAWMHHFLTVAAVCWALWLATQRDPGVIPGICHALAAGALIAALQGWFQHFGGLEEEYQAQLEYAKQTGQALSQLMDAKMRQTRSLGSFGDPNAYGAQLLLSLPFLLWEARQLAQKCSSPKAATALLLGAAAILGAGALVFSGSRGAMLGAFAGLLLVALCHLGRRLGRAGRILLACFLLLGALGAVAMLNRLSQRKLETVTVRLEYYQSAWKIYKQFPVLGAGLGEFYPWHFRLKTWEGDEARDPHSLFFAQLSQCGIPGALEALARLLAPLAAAAYLLKRRKAPLSPLQLAILGAWTSWTAHALVQFNDTVLSTATLAGSLGLLLQDPNETQEEAPLTSSRLRWWLSRAPMFLLALLCLSELCEAPGKRSFQLAQNALQDQYASYSRKKELLLDAIQKDPSAPIPPRMLADLAIAQEDYPTAREALKELRLRAPHRSTTMLREWRLAILTGDALGAQKALDDLRLWHPTNLSWWLLRGLEERHPSLPARDRARLAFLPMELRERLPQELRVQILSLPQQDAWRLRPLLAPLATDGVPEDLSHRTLRFLLPENTL
jgi:hypothetical protein